MVRGRSRKETADRRRAVHEGQEGKTWPHVVPLDALTARGVGVPPRSGVLVTIRMSSASTGRRQAILFSLWPR